MCYTSWDLTISGFGGYIAISVIGRCQSLIAVVLHDYIALAKIESLYTFKYFVVGFRSWLSDYGSYRDKNIYGFDCYIRVRCHHFRYRSCYQSPVNSFFELAVIENPRLTIGILMLAVCHSSRDISISVYSSTQTTPISWFRLRIQVCAWLK